MDKYKPAYLGKLLPVDNTAKMTDFIINKFDAFNKVYNGCKNFSDRINDINIIDTSNNDSIRSITVKIYTDSETISNIAKSNTDPNVTINNDLITVK